MELQGRRCRYTHCIQKACQAFNEAFGHKKNKKVFRVDATQGNEKENGIFSCGRHDGGTGFLQDRRRICVGLSRLRDEMILVAHASLVKPTRSSRPTPLWTHMYKVWQRFGVVIDIGKISGQNLTAVAEHIIRFKKPKEDTGGCVDSRVIFQSILQCMSIVYGWCLE